MANYCTTALKSIAYDCTPSKGGIVEAWVANFAEGIFTTSADTSGNTFISEIATGVTWYNLKFRRNTGSATSTLNVDDATGLNYVGTDLALQFARQDTPKRAAVAALALGGLAGIYKDANGKYWAIGVEAPVYSTGGGAATGTAVSDGNNYTITLHDDASSFPYEVAAEAVSNLPTE